MPSFLYGPLPGGRTRTLPDVRRLAFGPPPDGLRPRPRARRRPTPGTAPPPSGARRVLVAYNVWVSSVEVARRVAPLVRGPEVRALGLAVGARAQVSCNLVDPDRYGPEPALRRGGRPGGRGGRPRSKGASWWGSSPRSVLATVPPGRRAELGLSEEATVESRLPC